MSTTPGPDAESLPPKKRNPRQASSSEQPPEHDFKAPTPYRSQDGARRPAREPAKEPGARARHHALYSPRPFAPAPAFSAFWNQAYAATATSPFLPALAWDVRTFPTWGELELFPGSGRPTPPFEWHSVGGAPVMLGGPSAPPALGSYVTARPREVSGHSYGGMQGHGSTPLFPKPHVSPLASRCARWGNGADGSHGWHAPAARTLNVTHHTPQVSGRQTRRGKEGAVTEGCPPKSPPVNAVPSASEKHRRTDTPATGLKHVYRTAAPASPSLPRLLSPGGIATPGITELPLLVGSGDAGALGQQQPHGSPGQIQHVRVQSSPSSALPGWLLPHFAVGSLVELRGGRLKKVEDLQMEDFQLCADACPEFRLSRCTVQRISPSPTPDLSHLRVLLDDCSHQDSLEVFVEFPFFVRGRGWSSCCPLRTTRLCGLRCRQLCVGDVCLALVPTPAPSAQPSTAARREEEEEEEEEEGAPGPLKCSPNRLTERQRLAPPRKRRWSAPELNDPHLSNHANQARDDD